MNTEDKKQSTLAVINALTEMAYDGGFADGVEVGQHIGFTAGVTSLKAALACGLRHGSPECGKALESFKRLGLTE
ncbi:hypothetical protein [Pseudomonas abietaniphila]|uniref:Uncharacterized protein n=1 Tax=Pseudomonas abietaniphila TaxID=89065 RepID=A0A1G8R0Y0_9PSED|nr:hypothetical protein [Pseudomonas abietaniphila]SDJ10601.1 hypothetical protein SAMN05216605_121127 [Pseudomonas abietaniphila]